MQYCLTGCKCTNVFVKFVHARRERVNWQILRQPSRVEQVSRRGAVWVERTEETRFSRIFLENMDFEDSLYRAFMIQKLGPPVRGPKCSFVGTTVFKICSFEYFESFVVRSLLSTFYDYSSYFRMHWLIFIECKRCQQVLRLLASWWNGFVWISIRFLYLFPPSKRLFYVYTQIQYCCSYLPLHPQYIPFKWWVLHACTFQVSFPTYHPQSNQVLLMIGSNIDE